VAAREGFVINDQGGDHRGVTSRTLKPALGAVSIVSDCRSA
jgi:hypothetical protein